ncbi:MAG: hypothetical protein IPK27_17250 [Rhodanobacteraceae bacterium]|nr:hypothetical protein [Rhodanobacteraceae bacterium]
MIYAYISAAWSDSGLGDLGSKLDELLLGSKKLWSKETDGQLDSVDPALLKLIRENEDLSAKTLGETAASMITNNSHGKPLTRLCMARALEALRMQLSRQRTQIPQSTI